MMRQSDSPRGHLKTLAKPLRRSMLMPDPAHNERIKLLANGINNLAVAFTVAGFVVPAASGQMKGPAG